MNIPEGSKTLDEFLVEIDKLIANTDDVYGICICVHTHAKSKAFAFGVDSKDLAITSKLFLAYSQGNYSELNQ